MVIWSSTRIIYIYTWGGVPQFPGDLLIDIFGLVQMSLDRSLTYSQIHSPSSLPCTLLTLCIVYLNYLIHLAYLAYLGYLVT